MHKHSADDDDDDDDDDEGNVCNCVAALIVREVSILWLLLLPLLLPL